jgi:hypothetical protein
VLDEDAFLLFAQQDSTRLTSIDSMSVLARLLINSYHYPILQTNNKEKPYHIHYIY